jgi:hypothetical protein
MNLWHARRLRLRQTAHARGKTVRRCRVELLEARTLLAGLVQAADLNYLGAFNVPQGDLGISTFEYGGTAIAYNPADRSLLMVGHDWDQAIAEIDIPGFGTGDVTQLPTAPMLQPFSKVLSRVPNNTLDPSEMIKVGGLAVDGNRIIGTAYEYYDGAGDAVDSHFTLSSLNLATANVTGLYQVGELGGGFVGGYMTQVPHEWQDEVGAPYLTGQAALSIISRTSAGPAAFGFDPNQLGPTTAPVEPLVYYPIDHPLASVETQNPLFNTTTQIRGVVMPKGSDSVLFIGSHGVGDWWYGDATGDPFRHDQGPHAPPYVYQVWAYDIHDLIAIRDGRLQPWEAQPYSVWQLDLPYADGANEIGGVAYDEGSGQIFVSQLHGNDAYPVVHAFDLNVGEPPGDAVLSPPALSNTSVSENSAATSSVLVGTLSATSPDPNATLTFTLTAGEGDQNNGVFQIVDNQLLVRQGERLDFEAQASYSVRVRVADARESFAEQTFVIQVTNTNDAPVLDVTPVASLTSIQEEQRTSAGSPIEMLLGGVTDQDAQALAGIAVIGVSGTAGGAWQYSLNSGSTWNALGTPADSAARLLPANGKTRLRFVPNADFSGDVAVQYRAWDQTQGNAGGTFNLSNASATGGTQAFSDAAARSTLSVLAVNDAPRLDASLATALDSIQEDDSSPTGTPIETLLAGVTDPDPGALRGLAVTAVTGATSGIWQYTLDGATWQALGVPTASAARLLPANGVAKLRFLPKLDYSGLVTLSFRAWDQTQGVSGGTFDLSKTASRGGTTAFSTSVESAALVVAPVNDAPVLSGISGSIGYSRSSSAIVLAPLAIVTDVDSATFAGGTLTVEVIAGAESSNRLELGGTTFSIIGKEIYKSGLLIGTITSDGVGLNKFEIVFTENATKAVVQQLIRSIRFRTSSDSSLNSRTISFAVTDGDGGTSAPATKTVAVR